MTTYKMIEEKVFSFIKEKQPIEKKDVERHFFPEEEDSSDFAINVRRAILYLLSYKKIEFNSDYKLCLYKGETKKEERPKREKITNLSGWFCPRCGSELVYPDESQKLQGEKEKNCNVTCPNKKCSTHFCELTIHHPVNGVGADPGDSWSISWIK